MSSSSTLLSASWECSKSRFGGDSQKKSPLECQTSFSKLQNENSRIRPLIESFRAQFQVRLRVFLLIYLPVALDFNFESYIRLILDLIFVFLSLRDRFPT